MPDRRGFPRFHLARGLALAGALAALPGALGAGTWRIGDGGQPWRTFPVSYRLDAGEVFRHDFIWGGPHAVEIVVDDDGDGLIDEDPVEIVDNDGDGLFNEDPPDGIDSDRDGLVDEDGVEAQFDNDGDGLLNEDGMRTGGVVYEPVLRAQMESPPFERYPTPEAAAGDPEGRGTAWGDGGGYGWGDDDRDVNFNEDGIDGIDNDGDGLVDEDPPGPPLPLPGSLLQVVFAYDGEGYTGAERRAISFYWDPGGSRFVGEGAPRGGHRRCRGTPTQPQRLAAADPPRRNAEHQPADGRPLLQRGVLRRSDQLVQLELRDRGQRPRRRQGPRHSGRRRHLHGADRGRQGVLGGRVPHPLQRALLARPDPPEAASRLPGAHPDHLRHMVRRRQ